MTKHIINKPCTRKTYFIDCSKLVDENCINVDDFINFLTVTNKLTKYAEDRVPGGSVTIAKAGDGKGVKIDVGVQMSKIYLKMLTKKYFHKNGLKDWVKVVSGKNRNSYTMVYYNTDQEE